MKPLTLDTFTGWLDSYGKASQDNDARASAELFASNARYYETPFGEPMIGREAIYQYWLTSAQALKDKQSTYEVYSVEDRQGIARWRSKFTVAQTGLRMALDCLFLVAFDEDGLCSEFREWWHVQATDVL